LRAQVRADSPEVMMIMPHQPMVIPAVRPSIPGPNGMQMRAPLVVPAHRPQMPMPGFQPGLPMAYTPPMQMGGMPMVVPAPNGAALQQADQLREDMENILDAADSAEKSGDVEGAKFKRALAGEIWQKIKDLGAEKELLKSVTDTVKNAEELRVEMERILDIADQCELNGDEEGARAKKMQAEELWQRIKDVGDKVPNVEAKKVLPTIMIYASARLGFRGAMPLAPGQPPDQIQLQALAYDQERRASTQIEPDVTELCHHFQLHPMQASQLNAQLKGRNATYDDDLAALYKILASAGTPGQMTGLLSLALRWMQEGTFNGIRTPNPGVGKCVDLYNLDPSAAFRLAEAMESREDADEDLRKVITHLERSNKPSAMVMKMLKDMKSGNAIDECTMNPAVGSYLHREECLRAAKRSEERKDRRGGSRGRGGRRSRSRRDRRSRSRRDRRSRSRRGGGKSRSRSKGGKRR